MTIGTPVGGVYIPIDGDNSGFRSELRQSERVARTSTGKIRREFDKTTGSVDKLNRSVMASRTSMVALGAAAGVAMTAATRVMADFGQAMSTVRAVTGANEKQFDKLNAKARELGAITRFSATQVADGMTFLARAGFDVDEVLGSIQGTLQLAQSGNMALADAADIASNVLKGMGLEVEETGRVVDILAKASNSANTNVRQLGDALKYVAPISAGLGVGLEETTAAIGALSDAGLQGEMAGTGLRKVMISLEKQSKEGRDILAKYGLSLSDVAVSANGLTPALHKLAEAGITTGEAMTLFGLRGGPASEVLVNTVLDVEKLRKKLDEAAGTAAHVSKVMDDNLNGAILRARSAMEELILALGDAGASDALMASFEGLANIMRVAAENADLVALAFVALSARALLPMAAAVVGPLILKIAALSNMLLLIARNAGIATAAATLMSSTLAAIGGPVTLAILAAAAAYVTLARNTGDANDKLDDLAATMARISSVNDDIASDTKRLQVVQSSLTRIMEEQGSAAESAARMEIDALQTRIAKNQELGKVYEALARSQLAQSEIAARAERAGLNTRLRQQAGDIFAGSLLDSGSGEIDTTKAIDQFLDRVRRIQDSGGILDDHTAKTLEMVTQYQQLTQDVDSAREAIEALNAPITATSTSAPRLPSDASPSSSSSAEASAAEDLGSFAETVLGDGLSAQDVLSSNADIIGKQADALERYNKQSKTAFELELARLDLANAKNAKDADAELAASKRVNDLERELYIQRQISALLEANVGLENAKRIADQRANELGARGAFDPDEIAEARDGFRQLFKGTLKTAIQDEDVGAAIRSVFADRAAAGLERALDNLADTIFDLFSSVFKDIGSNGLGSAIGNIFGGLGSAIGSFAGGRASGGPVKAGSRYMVGERGAEMFVPSTDGFIIPNQTINPGTVPGMGSAMKQQIVMGDIIVQGDASEKTLALIQQSQQQQAAQLPGMIDARVADGLARGRF